MKNKNLFMTEKEKDNLIKTLKEGKDLIAIETIKKTLPRRCFVGGNKSAIDFTYLDKLIKVQDTFVSVLAKRWNGKLSEMPDNHTRFVAATYLAATDFGCRMTEGINNQLFAELGYKPATKEETEYLDKAAVRKVADRLGMQTDDVWEKIVNVSKTMPSQMIANAVSNIQKNIDKSKSKKVKAKNIRILADPSISEVRAYGEECSYRPDISIQYDNGEEEVLLIAEHFGWTGSQQYTAKETEKLSIAVTNGTPFWYSSPFDYPVEMKEAPDNLSSLEKDVWNWTKKNWFTASTTVDATEQLLRAMLSYAGLERFMLPIEELFLKNN